MAARLPAGPHHAEIFDRPERGHDELPRLDARSFRHEIVVRCGQRERQHDGNRDGRRGSASWSAWSWSRLWSEASRLVRRGLTTQIPIVALRHARLGAFKDVGAWRKKASHPGYMGSPYVREAVEDWLAYIGTERQLAAKTSEAYERDISQFLAFLAVHFNRLPDMPQLLALQARDVRAFLASRRSEGVGSRSLSRTLSALRMFYKFLERRGYGKNDAIRAVALPKLPHSVPKPLTAPKATALVDGADIAAPNQPEWISPATPPCSLCSTARACASRRRCR